MAYTKDPRAQHYASMTSAQRVTLALNTGAHTAVELQQRDCVLAAVMRRCGDMQEFRKLRGTDCRRDRYLAMSNSELLRLTIAELKRSKPKIRFLSELRTLDGVLYQALRARQLTTPLADALRLEGHRREPKARSLEREPAPMSRKAQYRMMSDDELFERIRSTGLVGSAALIRHDSMLYSELSARPPLRGRMVELGWRRAPLKAGAMSVEDWVKLCSEFDSSRAFQKGYTAAYGRLIRSGLWPEVKAELLHRRNWSSIVGLDGCIYDSRAESIVANLLHLSQVAYEPHPILPWTKNAGRFRADFQLSAASVVVEVFMCSESGLRQRSDLPAWASNYVCERQKKERLYAHSKLGGQLVTIEAEIYRYQGITPYVHHIRSAFASKGVVLADVPATHLLADGEQRGMKWSLDEFLAYAEQHQLQKLSDFDAPGRTDLYRALTTRGMRDDVRAALDQKYGRRVAASGKFKLSVDDLRAVCDELGITNKTEYTRAYKEGRLPIGAPGCIRQTYKVDWSEFFGRKRRDALWAWEQARAFVRAQGFASMDEFLVAVRTRADMQYVRKSPRSRVGGYPEFKGWRDFLGKA